MIIEPLVALLALICSACVGGAIALVPIKLVLGPQLKMLTDAARHDASTARRWAVDATNRVDTLEQRFDDHLREYHAEAKD